MPDLYATFYLRINNLLKIKNVLNVYPFTGEPDDDEYINDPDRSRTNVAANGQEYSSL